MDFRLSEEQELLLDSVREFMAQGSYDQYFRECDDKHAYPTAFCKDLVDAGFGLLGIPEEYGGTSVDTLTMMLVKEELVRLGASNNIFSQAFQIDTILTYGTEEQKKTTMELTLQGKLTHCSGFTEPQAGSDNNAVQTTYTRRNGKIYINGHKTFITNAMEVPYMMCLTKDPTQEDQSRAFTMWWLPMDAPGVEIRPLEKIGWNMLRSCEVYLNDVEVEEKDMLGTEGNAFVQLMKNFEVERILMAASALGMAECAFEEAARYANQRVQFGKTIGSFQLIQNKIVEMSVKIQNMKNLVYKSSWEYDNGISTRNSSALAKLYCARAANEVIDDALQIMGGIGYTKDCRISRLWRDARVYRIGGGTDEVMIHVAGRGILKEYR